MALYVEKVPNRSSRPTFLLREAHREGKRVRKKTLANLTGWPEHSLGALRRVLAGDKMVGVDDVFSIERSWPHGHVEAVLGTIRKLGLDTLIASRRSRSRDLVVAMIVARVLDPCSKLATTRAWECTTLAQEMNVAGADVDELYDALDWLCARQDRIQNKLVKLHLKAGGRALYDVSSSSYWGRHCPLAAFGYNRDGRRDRPSIVYGVLTNREGCPVVIDVFAGNTADPATVPPQIARLCERFDLERVVLVGDRGTLTQARIESLREHPQLGWISALRAPQIRKLVEQGTLQLSLFDRQNLAEISSPDYPGERLVVCHNPLLADERRRKRDELLAATEAQLARIATEAARRTKAPLSNEALALKVGKVIGRKKMEKHFQIAIENGRLSWTRDQVAIEQEQALDGIYVIRTSETPVDVPAPDAVRGYKDLSHVERAFRTLKGVDLRVRPIFHRVEDHVRAHFFLCLLAYYVEWHMRRALAPMLFDDEDLPKDRATRDPVAPAQPSPEARRKKLERRSADDGLPLHSFHSLLAALATRVRNRCRVKKPGLTQSFEQITELDELQKKAFGLLGLFPG